MATTDVEENAFEREAKGPLPNGLQVLALEYRILQNKKPLTQRLWLPEHRLNDAGVDAVTRWGNSLQQCFNMVGVAEYIDPNCASIFGTDEHRRLRVDVIAAPDVLKRWTNKGANLRCLLRQIEADYWVNDIAGPNGAVAKLSQARLLPSVAHIFTEQICVGVGQSDHPRAFDWKGIADYEFFDEGDKQKPDAFARWVLASQATHADFERLSALYDACAGNVTSVYDAMRRMNAKPESQSFLVPGLVPRGALTLLLGNKKVGKSGMLLELLVAAARREKEWLDFPIDTSAPGFAVYLFGEDTEGEVANRVALMSGGETPYLLHTIPYNGSDIDSVLAALTDKVAVLGVDPARKFIRGDEDGSESVSDFFTKLETFARNKNCAVVISHHLKRNATPRTLADVAMLYRGSSVFLDRPRVTLATLRTKDETQFGIPAPDGVPLHNFLASTMFAGVRRLRRDEESFRHVSLDTRPAGEPKVPNTVATDGVLGAASRLISSGVRVTRTGKAGLFERKPAEIAGMPRAAVRAAVDTLVDQGVLDSNDGGVLTLPAVPRHDAVASFA